MIFMGQNVSKMGGRDNGSFTWGASQTASRTTRDIRQWLVGLRPPALDLA